MIGYCAGFTKRAPTHSGRARSGTVPLALKRYQSIPSLLFLKIAQKFDDLEFL